MTTCIVLVTTLLTFAQTTLTVNKFSNDYYAKIEISDTLEVFSKGWIAIYDNKTNEQIIKVVSDELAVSLYDGEVFANIKSLPYGEQSVIMYDDFNFDGKKDFAIEDGQNSCYHGPSFVIYLATDKGFTLSDAFTRLAQDYCGMFQVNYTEKKISTMTKSGCCWHEFTEYIIKNYAPKAIRIVTEEINGAFNYVTEQTWNGKEMVKKTTKTIDTEQEGFENILSFVVPENGKKVILYNSNNTLNYALIRKDRSVEFSYPIESIQEKPDFTFDSLSTNRCVTFTNKNATYTIYDLPSKLSVEILVDGKIYTLVGDKQSKEGGLDKLREEPLDNVVYSNE